MTVYKRSDVKSKHLLLAKISLKCFVLLCSMKFCNVFSYKIPFIKVFPWKFLWVMIYCNQKLVISHRSLTMCKSSIIENIGSYFYLIITQLDNVTRRQKSVSEQNNFRWKANETAEETRIKRCHHPHLQEE